MRNRILIGMLLPVVLVAVLIASWATVTWVPPLVDFMERRTDASLELVTELGLEKCENNFNYLLDLRLENDESMTTSLKRETLSEIASLSEQFDKIHVVVLDANGRIVTHSGQDPIQVMAVDDVDITGDTVPGHIRGKEARVAAYYFPIWRWFVVGYIYEEDYAAPSNLASKVTFGGVFGVLLATIVTAALAFYLRVNKPLSRLIHAAERVAGGELERVTNVGKDEIGRVTSAFNSMVDSLETDQQKIHEILSALRESEEIYRLVTEKSLSHILLLHNGEVIFANRSVLRDSGYSMKDLLDKKALEFVDPRDRAAVRRMVRQCMTGHLASKPLECRYVTKSGGLRWLELSAVPTNYQGNAVILSHGTDITQRKAAFEEQQRLEARLQQAQKMEAIGTLAGGIAHDFNNLLMGIQGNVSLMQLHTPSDHPHSGRMASIQQYVQNAAELTRQLLGYARGGKYEVKPTDINALVSQSSRMFGRTRKEIVIHEDLQAGIWSVEVDPGQIEQVLLNLYVNAWQAMPNGGKLLLKTENVAISQMNETTEPLKGGEYVCISVTDTGVGIDEETIQKIFDPFFTTKQRGRGTGLGLASAHGIISNHGGSILCQSEPDSGTTFSIYLPRSQRKPAGQSAQTVPAESGSGTILLVDDEAMVVDVGADMLKTLGYRVITAASGRIAAQIVEEQGDSIDLIILDMIMPEMGGAETFAVIREKNGTIPVLLCSGYSLEGQAANIMGRGCDGFIQKPFNIDVLSQRVRETLKKRERYEVVKKPG